MLAVNVRNLVKKFGSVIAVNGLSFNIQEGEIYGLIGPNGAGKTTTLRILATLLRPTSGEAYVYGYDVVKDARRVREIISYLPEEAGAYKHLTGYEYLKFMATFVINDDKQVEEMVSDAIEISGLGDRLRDKIKSYSKGMKRRLLVAKTLMLKPKLAILDEPTSGLDVLHAVYIRNTIKDYSKRYKMTVLISSHNMLEVEYLCDRVGLIDKGRLLIEGKPKELLNKFGVSNLEEVFDKVVRESV